MRWNVSKNRIRSSIDDQNSLHRFGFGDESIEFIGDFFLQFFDRHVWVFISSSKFPWIFIEKPELLVNCAGRSLAQLLSKLEILVVDLLVSKVVHGDHRNFYIGYLFILYHPPSSFDFFRLITTATITAMMINRKMAPIIPPINAGSKLGVLAPEPELMLSVVVEVVEVVETAPVVARPWMT